MNFSFKSILFCLFIIVLASACRDEDLNPVPEWESALHGFGQIVDGSDVNFIFGEPTGQIDCSLQWVSIDNALTAESMDIFVSWTEGYVDGDGNAQTADHGQRLYTTLTDVGSNRTASNFSVELGALKDLFADATFDYGNGSVSVFNNPDKPDRNNSFTDDDAFVISWAITSTDGLYFDSWSGSVCGDFVGANCRIPFFVVCESNLEGTYDMVSVAAGPWGCTDTFEGQSRWERRGDSAYDMYTQGDGVELLDMAFGVYFPCYGYPVEEASQGNLANGSVTINDVCNKLNYTGASQWDEVYSFNSISVSGDGSALTIDWINDYGEGGVSTFTRTDGTTWPNLTK